MGGGGGGGGECLSVDDKHIQCFVAKLTSDFIGHWHP